jgi:hypothetical protein
VDLSVSEAVCVEADRVAAVEGAGAARRLLIREARRLTDWPGDPTDLARDLVTVREPSRPSWPPCSRRTGVITWRSPVDQVKG